LCSVIFLSVILKLPIPCILIILNVLQLYQPDAQITQNKPTECTNFHINTSIRFLTSSACFEPHGFIFRKKVVTAVTVWCVYINHCLTPMHINIIYKNYEYSCLPEDEPTWFETCRRRPNIELKYNCTNFIRYLHLLYFCYMFLYHILHLQGKIFCPSLKTMYSYEVTDCGLYSNYVVNYKTADHSQLYTYF
jgi:hypothetical protein